MERGTSGIRHTHEVRKLEKQIPGERTKRSGGGEQKTPTKGVSRREKRKAPTPVRLQERFYGEKTKSKEKKKKKKKKNPRAIAGKKHNETEVQVGARDNPILTCSRKTSLERPNKQTGKPAQTVKKP